MKIRAILAIGVLTILSLNGCKDELIKQSSQQEEMVVTPFGLSPKSKTFLIENGYATKIENNHLFKIESKTGTIIQDLGEVISEQKTDSKGRTTAIYPFSNNDVLSIDNTAPANSDDTYSGFTAHWIVPVAPSQNTETIFIGQRMEIFDNSAVELEVALQYGPSAAGGGQYWSAGTWERTGSGIITYSTLVQNITPGTSLTGQIAWSGNSYDATMGTSHTQYIAPIALSDIFLFLGGEPKTTGSYPTQFSTNITNINIIHLVNGQYSSPSITWTIYNNSSSKGEHMKIVNSTSPNGEVDICFYGTPSGLWYPTSGSYPVSLSWAGTPGAVSYDINYTVYPSGGSPINGSVTSTTTSYTFPFANHQYSGGELVSKVRAHYSGGVISDWSSPYNITIQ